MLPQRHFCRTIYILCTQNTYDTSLAYIWTWDKMDENARNVQIILMLNYSSLCATSCMKSETLRAYSSALGEQSALREGSALPQRRRMCIVEAKPPARFGNIRFAALIANTNLFETKIGKKTCSPQHDGSPRRLDQSVLAFCLWLSLQRFIINNEQLFLSLNRYPLNNDLHVFSLPLTCCS